MLCILFVMQEKEMKRERKKQNEEEDKAETNKTAQLNIFLPSWPIPPSL